MHLTLHLTRACNMRCDYCYAPPRPDEGMSLETALAALRLGARLNAGRSCGVVFFGGEPLLRRELIAAVVAEARAMERRAADGTQFHFKLTTNGLLLDEAFLELAAAQDLLVAMSFDGVAAAHDAHRRLPDGAPSHGVLLQRLRLLLAARPYASVLLVVNPDTARHLAASVEHLVELGCRYLIVSLNHVAPWTAEAMAELRGQYEALAGSYARWTRAGRKFYLSPFEVKIASHVDRHCQRRDRCELGQRQLSVDPEGYLYPCVQFPRAGPRSEWCIGHVATGIDEQARGAILRRAQQAQDREACRGCAIAERCNHTCGCLNWQATGSVEAISPVLCAHEQMLVPIADRLAERLYRRRDPLFLHKHYNAAYPVLSMLEEALEEAAEGTAEGAAEGAGKEGGEG